MGAGAARVQLATYPQSPFSGPARCCDVTDLYQAFSQRTGPGRLWISLDAGLLFVLDWGRAKKQQAQNPGQNQKPRQFQLAINSKKIDLHTKKLILPSAVVCSVGKRHKSMANWRAALTTKRRLARLLRTKPAAN